MSAIAVERERTVHAHDVSAMIFHNITRCYGKHASVFAVAVATGDIIKYQSFNYGSFVWEMHVRYNKVIYYHIYDLEYLCNFSC